MKFCKNCGYETKKKICPGCGNKTKKGNNFCGWCGHELDGNAVVCPNCHEKLKDGFLIKVYKIVAAIIAIILIALGIVGIWISRKDQLVSSIFFILSGLFILPFTKNIIKNNTTNKSTKRKLLKISRVMAVVVFLCIGMSTLSESTGNENKVYSDIATECALQVFHDKVKLKNESSFVLNDSEVYSSEYNKGEKKFAKVTVYLDYSAENGFGGMNRKDYTVYLIYNFQTGRYSIDKERMG